MFALAIHYLNGWAMATAGGAQKERAEWPPHPDRVYMALAAAWFETGEDPVEGAALRWLESLPPPAIAASEAQYRVNVVSYVPVNDAVVSRRLPAGQALNALRDAGLALLPEYRPRQARGFPVAIPQHPVVHLLWDAELDEHRAALDRLAQKVTHVGHCASLVQMWLSDDTPQANWIPTIGLSIRRLRVPTQGRLAYLGEVCNRTQVLAFAEWKARAEQSSGKEKKRMKDLISDQFGERVPVSLRPSQAMWQGYTRPGTHAPPVSGSLFHRRILVFSLRGRPFSLPSSLRLLEAFRGSLMAGCGQQPPPEWFSGHRKDGAPTTRPHMALMPLSFSASAHSDGRVMGLAIALPVDLDPGEAGLCLEPYLLDPDTGLPREHRLHGGRWFECEISLQVVDTPPRNLRPETWTAASRTWASVTPVVLDRYFKGADQWEKAAESVKDACERIALPRPREVLLSGVSLHEGVPHAREFPALKRKSDGGNRYHTHAVIAFDQPVRGPVLIGAGRFRGYGVCRPANVPGRGYE